MRNFDATGTQKTTQLFTEKTGEKVARVARKIEHQEPPFNDPVFVRLAAGASRVCRDIHGDDDSAVAEMLEDLRHADPATWPALADHFEAQLHAQLCAQPKRNQVTAEFADPFVAICWTPAGNPVRIRAKSAEHAARLRADNPPPDDLLDALLAAGHEVELMDAAKPDSGSVRCVDCRHAELDGGIARCGTGVDASLAVGGFWHDDRHLCERFTAP